VWGEIAGMYLSGRIFTFSIPALIAAA